MTLAFLDVVNDFSRVRSEGAAMLGDDVDHMRPTGAAIFDVIDRVRPMGAAILPNTG